MLRTRLIRAAVSCFGFLAVLLNCVEARRLFRGSIGMSVFLCLYSDSPAPSKTRDFFERFSIRSGTGGHADYWETISYGNINFKGSTVRGWYRMDKTINESKAYGGGGTRTRGKKFTDCRDKAVAEGYTIPSGHIVVAITSPGIDAFGFTGGAFLGENTEVGFMSHEVGHALTLRHSYSDDPKYQNAPWSQIGEYDDQWDIMSYANVISKDLGVFGRGGPGLNAYHRDRMGWISGDKIFRFGADGLSDRTLILAALNRPKGPGSHLIRIPFDVYDKFRYYTVEYRLNEGWDSGFASDIVLIHEVKKRSNGDYVSYLIRDHDGARAPKQSINNNGVRIDVISKSPAMGLATVRVISIIPAERCIQGYVWREAQPSDRVCVTGARRAEVSQENVLGPSRRQPGGGAFGPDTCRQGYVWREAFTNDHVCVPPSSRQTAREENLIAWERRLGGGAYGPNTCKHGYVWREADKRDWVCVSPKRRSDVRAENLAGPSRRQPGGGTYGPDTCRQGYVWREAFPGDHVCVYPSSRSVVRGENALAVSRLALQNA